MGCVTDSSFEILFLIGSTDHILWVRVFIFCSWWDRCSSKLWIWVLKLCFCWKHQQSSTRWNFQIVFDGMYQEFYAIFKCCTRSFLRMALHWREWSSECGTYWIALWRMISFCKGRYASLCVQALCDEPENSPNASVHSNSKLSSLLLWRDSRVVLSVQLKPDGVSLSQLKSGHTQYQPNLSFPATFSLISLSLIGSEHYQSFFIPLGFTMTRSGNWL